MSKARARHRRSHHERAGFGRLPDDVYAYAGARPTPRIGRPVKHDPAGWTVSDDWPDPLPVTGAEVDVFEAWFGDLFDDLFGPCRWSNTVCAHEWFTVTGTS